jgi:hypothetical protein
VAWGAATPVGAAGPDVTPATIRAAKVLFMGSLLGLERLERFERL